MFIALSAQTPTHGRCLLKEGLSVGKSVMDLREGDRSMLFSSGRVRVRPSVMHFELDT